MYMNQTKKRLSIINLSISITDIETIQLQVLKLALLKTDTKIQEIITVLQAENYAKAQRLIKVYIDTPMEEILQRSSQHKSLDIEELTTTNKKETIISKEDQKIIDEFQLFTTNDDNNPRQAKKKEININDYLTDVPNTPDTKADTPVADFDDLLNLEAADVMPDNIELDISQDPNDSFFNLGEKLERSTLTTKNVPRDTFFDINEEEETPVEEILSKENTKQKPAYKMNDSLLKEQLTNFDIPAKEESSTLSTENVSKDTFFEIDEAKETSAKESPGKDPFETLLTVGTNTKASFNNDGLTKKAAIEKTFREKASLKTPLVEKETKQKPSNVTPETPEEQLSKKSKVKVVPENYPAISYIRQKFVSMRKQYEPIQKGHDRFPTVETFLTTISQDGYKEKEIEETFQYIEKLITEQKFSEAAQLLLVCASTESQFAQLMLARELYRGVLLRKKVSEAFTILTHMADDKYPEALCDLGQFYENAISTGRDRKRAEELYKQAMDLGITRAAKHYARLKKQNKGFFRK